MPDYLVYGGCLRSELKFSELTEARGQAPDWTLRLGNLSRNDHGELLSDVELSPKCRIRLSRGDGWLRYSHSCTGTFEVFAQGRRILFEPAIGGNLTAACTDFVSRVLLHCVDRTSVTWLHGSAVRAELGAIGFLGASGSGKSTLALALARAGADHICDDTLPIEAGTPPVVWASEHTIRLCSDSKSRLAPSASAARRESDGKFVLAGSAFASFRAPVTPDVPSLGRAPLAALYLLGRDESQGHVSSVTRRQIRPTAAVPALMGHLKLGPVVRPEDPARIVKQLGSIASAVPVYELRVPRNWEVFDEVVTQILAWHVKSEGSPGAFVPALATVG